MVYVEGKFLNKDKKSNPIANKNISNRVAFLIKYLFYKDFVIYWSLIQKKNTFTVRLMEKLTVMVTGDNECMDGYKMITKQILITEIEIIRERMIVTGLEEGFNSHNTIKMSEIMDQLLNELQKVDK